jgi:predicted PurR-regulated permease PerM
MEQPTPQPPKERNQIIYARHRKEVIWQIILPVLMGLVICLALSLVVTRMTNDQVSTWADISVIWLIIPALVGSLILSIIMAAAIYATYWLIRELPFYFFRAYTWLRMLNTQVSRVGDKAVEPFLRGHSFSASVRKLGSQVKRK